MDEKMNAKQKRCMKLGHDWAFKTDLPGEFILAQCLRCGAKQYFYLDETVYDSNVDDDGPKESVE